MFNKSKNTKFASIRDIETVYIKSFLPTLLIDYSERNGHEIKKINSDELSYRFSDEVWKAVYDINIRKLL